jgi:hypothetical protein
MNRRAILVMATLGAVSLGIALFPAKGFTGTWPEVGTPDENEVVVQGTLAYFESSTVSEANKRLHLKGRVLDLPELDRPSSEGTLHA